MFSCCCARVDFRWDPVCDCWLTDKYCDGECVSETCATYPESYYQAALDIYSQVQQLYPQLSVWLTGHSLGASIAALVGLTVCAPVIAFQAPPDLLFAERIGFEIDRNNMTDYLIFHVGNDGDPFYLGECNGFGSTCYTSGYALETKCHLGNRCVYTGARFVQPTNHQISNVISDWIEPAATVPACLPRHGCSDCTDWTFL
eukprot:TRINITY_DN4360_c0_g1_i1.p1 TRINITY_DN4360_c0_g1~~TRINITY_DN4360_c0_g1_i1.p1  ORF type:complete len:201 (+),score=42.50 TRINITY_DN4360_c0_g1_i1:567-1169(+)